MPGRTSETPALEHDPMLAPIVAAVETLDTASLHDLLDLLRDKLARLGPEDSVHAARQAHCVSALREAADLLRRSPSVEGYEALRREHPDRGWPSESTVRRVLGGGQWAPALAASHLEAIADADVLVMKTRTSYSLGELTECIRECARELAAWPSWPVYVNWARSPGVTRRLARRASSLGPFNRHGGWQAVLDAATSGVSAADVSLPTVRARPGRKWSTEELIDVLREMAGRLGQPPRTTDYDRLKREMEAEAAERGETRLVPSIQAFGRLGATWDERLAAAGLQPQGGRHTPTNPRRSPKARFEPEELTDALRRALSDCAGEPLGVSDYRAWRTRVQAEQSPEDYVRIPSYETIVGFFGGWEKANAAARAAGREREDR